VTRGRWGAVAALALLLAGCGYTGDGSASTLHPLATASAGTCSTGQAYAHATLGYHACFPDGWRQRDYTAEPGANGALSVVAFGPDTAVPSHVPQSTEFAVPIQVRVLAGPKDGFEASLTSGNQVDHMAVAGTTADRIKVTQDGPAQGTVIVVFEHQGDTFELEKAPGSGFGPEFDQFVASFGF
jgi:hypothetical protein